MAMVYLGDDLRLGRNVAIKIMHAHLADDENFTRRFEQEARSAAGLGHPNVVNVFDQGEAQGVPYLIMEYLPGITLRDLLKQQRQLTTEQVAEIAEALLAGLSAAHESGIVHRDLKPENVLLADDGRIKIGDFGLARAVSANTTTGQALLGTIAYLSPELVTRGVADARSDLYAFGILLYEMLTGRQPYTGEQPMQIAYQHAHSDVPAPSAIAPEVPEEFDRLVQWTTGRDPDARPDTAREALDYLRAVRAGDTFAATAVLPATTSFGTITPSTAVLSDADQQLLADNAAVPVEPAAAAQGTAVADARKAGSRRAKRGRWIAAVVTLFVALAAGGGWWFGQGPGSTIPVPDVSGLDLAAAQKQLEASTLVVESFECSSLEIAAGLAALTEPAAGTRVDRGSTVRLCTSTGPALLDVPALIGLTVDEAKIEIEKASFVFGEVVEEQFDGGTKGAVILAVNEQGEGIGATYPEQGTIDLIVSAGSVPDVSGLTAEDAAQALTDAGLVVDASANTEAHNDEIEKGRVISVALPEGTVSVGSTVSLNLSLGPELIQVPDIAAEGLSANQAAAKLRELGFEVDSGLVDIGTPAGDLFGVKRTVPAAGEMVPKGTVISFRYI